MISIRARKTGPAYSIDKRSSEDAVNAFNFIMKGKLDHNFVHVEKIPSHDQVESELAARCIKKIIDHYPDYTWRVEIDNRPHTGVVNIYNEEVNEAIFGDQRYGYVLHLSAVQSDVNLMCVMRAAGEILERANLSRGRNRGEDIVRVDGVKDRHQPWQKSIPPGNRIIISEN